MGRGRGRIGALSPLADPPPRSASSHRQLCPSARSCRDLPSLGERVSRRERAHRSAPDLAPSRARGRFSRRPRVRIRIAPLACRHTAPLNYVRSNTMVRGWSRIVTEASEAMRMVLTPGLWSMELRSAREGKRGRVGEGGSGGRRAARFALSPRLTRSPTNGRARDTRADGSSWPVRRGEEGRGQRGGRANRAARRPPDPPSPTQPRV